MIKVVQHRIELEEWKTLPINSGPHWAGRKARELEKQEIEKMLAMDVTGPAHVEWSSPIVLVQKKEGKHRFCAIYRKLNAVTIRELYLIPCMHECIAWIAYASLFPTLDAYRGDSQVKITKWDHNRTALTSHPNLFCILRMPFGLKSARWTFQQHAMDVLLMTVKLQFASV